MPQLSYPTTHDIGFPGMLADSARDKLAESFFSEETGTTEIPFGVMLKQGVGDHGALKLTAIANKLIGISVHTHAGLKGTSGGLLPKSPISVLVRGRIYVKVEDAVTPASKVYARAVATGSEVAGAFRGTADGTDTIELFGSSFKTSASAGGIVLLHWDLLAFMSGARGAVLP